MMKYSLVFTVISISFLSCSSLKEDISYIEKDLGIKFPQKFYILQKQKDFLGFEETWKYEFSFEELEFDSIINDIKNSFNFEDRDTFSRLNDERQLKMLNELSKRESIGWWVKNKNGYEFKLPDCKYEIFDRIENSLRNRNIRNRQLMSYSIEAEIDITNRILFYKYMQL